MISKIKMALAAVAGIALGAVAIQSLHAQAKPPVYVVIDISEVIDRNWLWTEGMGVLMQPVEKFGGRYLARTDKITALDGTPPARFSIIAFDSLEQAQAWDKSEAQKIVTSARTKRTKSRSFVVEGREVVATQSPVYMVIDISEITNNDYSWAESLGQMSQPVEKFGGRYLARAIEITALDGTPPARFSIIAFDSLEQAQAWDKSEIQKKVTDTRTKTTKSRSFVVEGLPQ